MDDLAVVGMDPGFGGGVLAQTEAFLDGVRALGREPSYHYLAHPSLQDGLRFTPGTKAPFGRFDAANQVAAGRLLAPALREARSVWVCSTTAAYGYPAARSDRPFGCWLGAGLREEWAGRRPGLSPLRRVALAANAPFLLRLERQVIRGATRVYATSPSSRAEIARAGGIGENRIGILPIPVDLDRFRPLPDDEWRARLGSPVLAFVGRADDPRKNVQLLLEAFAKLEGPRLRLIGAAPRSPLPPGAEATGPVESVAEHLRDAALLVLPSRHEGFGIVAAEALACGVPVVTTPTGGPEELVRGSGAGVVLEGFSPEELAGAIRRLLGDPASLMAMREAGRGYVEREHSPARFRELLAHAFDELDAT